ncbi:MAG TPA: methyltransferase [Terriglobales bacterium]|nr:methyltransferase [Terriglobales bacterium]
MDLTRRWRAFVYDRAIVPMTAGWYAAVLEQLAPGSRLLDVGIGTAAALLANTAPLRARDVHVVGVDIDAAYIERARRHIAALGLAERIEPRLESIYDHRGGPYDAAYFSASFMLLPDPAGALRHVRTLLKPGAPVYFTQTFEQQRAPGMEIIKPLLRLVTTIDFGRVTYREEFEQQLTAARFAVEEWRQLHAGKRRAAMLVVAAARG